MGKWWTVAAVVTCIALGVVTAACGDDDDDSGGGDGGGTASADGGCPSGVKDELKAKLDQYREVPAFEAPGPAFDASQARGKKVFNIPLLSTDTFNQIVDKASAEAAKVAGLEFIQYNNEGDPAQWVAGMNQAIAQNSDLIILEGGPDPAALEPQLAAAERAGIPVISTHRFDVDAVEEQLEQFDLAGIVPAQHYLGSGELTADYAMYASDCDVNALVLEAADVQPTSAGITKRFQDELAKYCPETCKAESINMPFSDWAQSASGEMQTKLTSDPEINFIAPNFDQGAIYARQAILSAGADDRVKIVAYNGSAPVMQMLADGESVISEVGEPLEWLGWQNIDQALRILAGEDPVTSATPVRLFDESNIAEAGEPVEQTEGYGPASQYEDGFKELWGIE
jgi:ribose transport system substrate-binding protein